MRVHVFLAGSFEGTETETEEAAPVWCEEASLPYDEMWQDDPLWLPHVLRGSHVYGRFLFDDDAMLYGGVILIVGAALLVDGALRLVGRKSLRWRQDPH